MGQRWVGQAVPRVDALAKVTGQAVYTSDVDVPGMCHGVLVRSHVAHGLIRSIDVSAAEAMPGVVCTLVGSELAQLGVVDAHYGLAVHDQAILTDRLVRFAGEPIAAVVAETQAAAELAAALVVPDIEVLPPVTDAVEAMTSDIRVHPERESEDPSRNNIVARFEFTGGDVDRALAEADYVHEATYRFPMIAHYPMEPYCSIAYWSGPAYSRLEVTSGTQQAFKVRADLARMFAMPLNHVVVRAGYVGGGFGGKLLSKYEPLAAVMARKAMRPVRLLLGAEESFRTVTRHGAVIHMRTGVDKRGNIVARDTEAVFDTGAYADKGPGVAKKAAYRSKGPYEIPNFRSVALSVYTNKVPAGAFRGYSTPQVAWAGESAVNEIARRLGRDPLEYRLEHLAGRGGEFMPGDTPLDADLAEGLSLAASKLGWDRPLVPGRGRGLASGVKDGGGGPSRTEAEVRLLSDGSVEVLTGTTEMGQGAQTVFTQIAAEELGCDLRMVHSQLPDTATSPFDHGTEASRSTVLVGHAVRKAATCVREELALAVASMFPDAAEFSLDGDCIRLPDGRAALLADVIATHRHLPPAKESRDGLTVGVREFELGPIVARAHHETYVGSDSPLGTPTNFYEVGHGAVELEVDEDTGEIDIHKYVSVADVGKAINPQTCTGQDDGSALMGLGHTLFEELVFEDGELLTTTLDSYTLPRFEDMPREGLHSFLLENEDGPGPYGAKGAGEGGIISVSPAIAEAIFQACGVRFHEIPLTPERVWRAIRDHRATPPAAPSTDDMQ